MSKPSNSVVLLSEMTDGQEADCFVLMTSKEEATTRTGKPYFRVGFRDAQTEVNFPIWSDSTCAIQCRDEWKVGTFYKVRAVYRQTNYGPQLDIHKIREVTDEDRQDGFDELMCQQTTRFQPEQMFDQLVALAEEHIEAESLRSLVVDILNEHCRQLLALPAAVRNHHAFAGGLLEHTLSVTRTCVYLADKYQKQYPDLTPPLSKDLIVAGGVLHDIGKLRELQQRADGAAYTVEGALIGHVLQGRDVIREAAARQDFDGETLLRLEHVIVAHQRLAEWGSPKPPMTPEALIVHYADDIDAKLQMMYETLRDDGGQGPMTSRNNPMRHALFRGLPQE